MTLSTTKRFLSIGSVSAFALSLALGVATVPSQAHAAASVSELEKQIQMLQDELNQIQAQQQAMKASQDAIKSQQAVTQEQVEQASDNATTAYQKAASFYDKKKGFKLGALQLKIGGFVAAEGVVRDKNEVGDIGSSFSNSQVPFRNSPNYHQDEIRGTARQSRLSLMLSGHPDQWTSITGYFEGDFLGAAVSANSKESNSYTPRIRQVWLGYERSDLGLHVFAGQTWSLATLEKKGMMPLDEMPPLTIDASYVPGFSYLRNPELRVVKDFDQKYWLGVAIDNPQSIIAGTAPGTVENVTNNGNGFGMQGSSLITYTNNIAPDITIKAAVDTDLARFEVFGIGRFFEDRITVPGFPKAHNNEVEFGGGIGAATIVHIVPKVLDVTLNGLAGQGVGRYGSTQLPDVTYRPDGSFKPIENLQAMAGIIYTPVPAFQVYGYTGIEQDHSTRTGAGNGYGAGIGAATTAAGCMNEGGACGINYHRIEQATFGDWWKFYQGAAGTMQWGVQLSSTRFDAFQGVGVTSTIKPHTLENQLYISFRYYPFQ